MRKFLSILYSLLLCGVSSYAQLGGEMDYRDLGNSNYRIILKLIVKMDSSCSGIDPLITPGNALYVTDNYNAEAVSTYYLISDTSFQLYETNDPCIVPRQTPCYREMIYHADIHLPVNFFGYTIAYETCCRADSNLNIAPLYPGTAIPEFDRGSNSAVLMAHLPGTKLLGTNSSADNSPVFDHDSLFNICMKTPFEFYYGATDPDEDSLVYDFVTANTYQVVLPPKGPPVIGQPPVISPPVPVTHPGYPPANYKDPYSGVLPLGAGVKIDRQTGFISGTIDNPGTYIVKVRALEYRNGKLIGQNTKEFEVSVYNCQLLPKPKAVIAGSYNTCNDYAISFDDSSTVLRKYRWDFGDGTAQTGSALNDYYPTHTYRDTGTFNVRLIVNPGYYCADTGFTVARVYPTLIPSFQYADSCIQYPINFINNTTAGYGTINYLHWDFGDPHNKGDSSDALDPGYQYSQADTVYEVTLTVGTDKGCLATGKQYVYVYAPPPALYSHDTILTHGQIFQLHAPAYYDTKYAWSPPDGLNDPVSADPVVRQNQDIIYHIKMETAQGCERIDTFKVRYFTGPDIYVPNAFTPNSDGINDIFRPVPVGITKIEYFLVFDRYGRKVFETKDYRRGWDGTLNGQKADIGSYVWEVKGLDINNKVIFKKGIVMLIR